MANEQQTKTRIGGWTESPYSKHMVTLTTPLPEKYLLPRDADAVGPQNEAERRLYALVREGLDGGPSEETSIAELTAELRARIQNKR
jgi:hypothetical protein